MRIFNLKDGLLLGADFRGGHSSWDAAFLKETGFRVARVDIEWTRVEPEEGGFDKDALVQYRARLDLFAIYGVKPLVTLGDMPAPAWFKKRGGFDFPNNLVFFQRFVEKTVETLGAAAAEYLTFTTPPANSERVAAHILTYKLIHEKRRSLGLSDTKVSVGFQMGARQNRFVDAVVGRPIRKTTAKAFLTGVFSLPFRNQRNLKTGKYADFLCVNYSEGTTFTKLIETCENLYGVLPLPVYVFDAGGFERRRVIEQLAALRESRLPIARFYYRCFTDAFFSEVNKKRVVTIDVSSPRSERSLLKR
jgi:hypothetical protein